jgi:hypothetical protein
MSEKKDHWQLRFLVEFYIRHSLFELAVITMANVQSTLRPLFGTGKPV